MSGFKKWFAREKYVALHAQPFWLRVVKYPVFIILFYCIYVWNGWTAVGYSIVFLLVLGFGFHFFLRWKTRGWTRKWWFVKSIKTPYDKK